MKYRIELKPKAGKDLKELSKAELERVVEHLRWLEDDLRGDVKLLTNHSPEYRMRAGDLPGAFGLPLNHPLDRQQIRRRPQTPPLPAAWVLKPTSQMFQCKDW